MEVQDLLIPLLLARFVIRKPQLATRSVSRPSMDASLAKGWAGFVEMVHSTVDSQRVEEAILFPRLYQYAAPRVAKIGIA